MKLRDFIIDQARNRIGLKGTDEQIIEFAKTIQQNHFSNEEFKKVEE